jgi:hypothetical protein
MTRSCSCCRRRRQDFSTSGDVFDKHLWSFSKNLRDANASLIEALVSEPVTQVVSVIAQEPIGLQILAEEPPLAPIARSTGGDGAHDEYAETLVMKEEARFVDGELLLDEGLVSARVNSISNSTNPDGN